MIKSEINIVLNPKDGIKQSKYIEVMIEKKNNHHFFHYGQRDFKYINKQKEKNSSKIFIDKINKP